MRRKTLIVLTLIAVMLLSSILPIVGVYATEGTTSSEMTFNTDLYNGLKAYFQEQGISAKYNDVDHSIDMTPAVLESIETISLKEKGISDISGIERFTNVKSLILSANKITEKSHLEVLNNLANLNYLDLSSNNIKDVSAIDSLITRLIEADSNSINISGQNAYAVIDVELDANEDKTTETFKLPQILELAGIAKDGQIQNRGYLKAEWFTESTQSGGSTYTPYVVASSIPNPITAENNKFDIAVGYETASSYYQRRGLLKLVISIKDVNPDAYSTNPASKNLLKDSIFTLYYVVHAASTDAVILKDRNLYNAVKDQLTREQEINSNLLSFQYETTTNGEIAYDVCDYTVSGTTATLTINGTTVYTISNFNSNGGQGTVTVTSTGRSYSLNYEAVDVSTADNNGVVTTKRKIKVPHINTDCRSLYSHAYDEPQVLVITDLDIVNKITSLILNDKRIYDLSGLEAFVGLESNLNVSYNYIDTLANIYALEKNKEAANASIQANFKEKKDLMAITKTKIETAYNSAVNTQKAIQTEIKKIEENIAIASSIADPAATERVNAIKAIQDSIKTINGDGADNIGLKGQCTSSLSEASNELYTFYERLASMYKTYNNEYKLTSLLIPELNYQTEEEYEAYLEKSKTLEGAKSLVKAEVARLSTLEKANALSECDKALIRNAFGIYETEDKTLVERLDEYVKMFEENGVSRSTWVSLNKKMIEVDLYAQAANYCLIKRMSSTSLRDCYAEEFFEKVIENYKYEGIDTKLVEEICNNTKLGGFAYTHNHTYSNYAIEDAFVSYQHTTSSGVYYCQGKYRPVKRIQIKITESTYDGIVYPNSVKMFETVEYPEEALTATKMYEQLMTLANKFTAIDETARYVNVPTLKKIDVTNNEIETLGPTELTMVGRDGTETTSTETLASIKNLKELYAGHNFVTGDIACVDWSTLTSLKSLDLSYNFIRDISPLQVLKNLRYLNVSDNLLGGSLNLSIREMEKLENLVLAGNQYSDISQLLNDFEMISGGNLTTYFAREDTVNIDLSRQRLVINIEEPIMFNPNANVKEVELPPIFAQLEYIDAPRTAFGTTSSKGSVQARGGVAYIPTNEVGDYQAVVTVIAKNGYPEEVTTSIGINTSCTINYKVTDKPAEPEKTVTGVTIVTDKTIVAPGGTVNMSATVTGTNLTVADQAVTWSITGNASSNTSVSEDGVLTIGNDETTSKITVTAASVTNSDVKATKEITVSASESNDTQYGYTISRDGTEVIGISPNTQCANFKTKFLNDPTYTLEVKRNGVVVEDNKYVATNDIVVVKKDGVVTASYELVVKGDVNGDGVADGLDSSLIKAHRAAVSTLTGANLDAADINNDGSVNIIDVRLLLYHRARVEGYIL